jgi:hypothetical protein
MTPFFHLKEVSTSQCGIGKKKVPNFFQKSRSTRLASKLASHGIFMIEASELHGIKGR